MDALPFDPLVAGWFGETFAGPTPAQQTGWASIGRGEDTLIAAPTGSGKTLAAFLSAIDGLVRRAQNDQLPDGTCILYVSPLKALGNDIEKNLEVPLAGIRERAESAGITMGDIRVAVRSGDTPASKRQAMLRKPPHILITTPESLYILLTAVKSRQILQKGACMGGKIQRDERARKAAHGKHSRVLRPWATPTLGQGGANLPGARVPPV